MNDGSYDVISKVIPEKCGYLCFALSSARALQRSRSLVYDNQEMGRQPNFRCYRYGFP